METTPIFQVRKLLQRGLATCPSPWRQWAAGRSAVGLLFLFITANHPLGRHRQIPVRNDAGCFPRVNPPSRISGVNLSLSVMISNSLCALPATGFIKTGTWCDSGQLRHENRLSQTVYLLGKRLLCTSGWYPQHRLLALWQPSCALRWSSVRAQHME